MQDIIETVSPIRNQPIDGLVSNIPAQQTIRYCVANAMQNYFVQLGDAQPSNLYELVLAEVEVPLLEAVLQRTKGNQTKAAILLGLSRGTLRKKLKQYQLED